MPDEWRGTTFNNSALLGREAFTQRLVALLTSKAAAGTSLALRAPATLIHLPFFHTIIIHWLILRLHLLTQ
jgi:hypothetical protein